MLAAQLAGAAPLGDDEAPLTLRVDATDVGTTAIAALCGRILERCTGTPRPEPARHDTLDANGRVAPAPPRSAGGPPAGDLGGLAATFGVAFARLPRHVCASAA